MKQSIRLGRVGGVPVGVHWSVAVIFGVVTLGARHRGVPRRLRPGTPSAYWVAAVVAATLFFVSLLAHEGSHAVVARRHGVGVRSITLWLFGGVAQLDGDANSPGADFTIAAVGPGMSIVLAGVFGAPQLLLERAGVHGPGRGRLVVAVADQPAPGRVQPHPRRTPRRGPHPAGRAVAGDGPARPRRGPGGAGRLGVRRRPDGPGLRRVRLRKRLRPVARRPRLVPLHGGPGRRRGRTAAGGDRRASRRARS